MSVGALDREALEKLTALGYLGAGTESTRAQEGPRADPKDVIRVFNRLRRANSAVRDRRFAEALPVLHEVLAEDPHVSAALTAAQVEALLDPARYAGLCRQFAERGAAAARELAAILNR